MFYYINPTYRYQFFSPDSPHSEVDADPIVNGPTDEPKRDLVNALISLYAAYGGEEELNNNAVDIIYKIADVINEKNNTPDDEAGSGGPPSEAGSGEQRT